MAHSAGSASKPRRDGILPWLRRNSPLCEAGLRSLRISLWQVAQSLRATSAALTGSLGLASSLAAFSWQSMQACMLNASSCPTAVEVSAPT